MNEASGALIKMLASSTISLYVLSSVFQLIRIEILVMLMAGRSSGRLYPLVVALKVGCLKLFIGTPTYLD
jgi:hypothetical protein